MSWTYPYQSATAKLSLKLECEIKYAACCDVCRVFKRRWPAVRAVGVCLQRVLGDIADIAGLRVCCAGGLEKGRIVLSSHAWVHSTAAAVALQHVRFTWSIINVQNFSARHAAQCICKSCICALCINGICMHHQMHKLEAPQASACCTQNTSEDSCVLYHICTFSAALEHHVCSLLRVLLKLSDRSPCWL